MAQYMLVEFKKECPKAKRAGESHGLVRHLSLRENGQQVRKWFFCRICTPPALIVPETVQEAYEIWQQFGRFNAFRPDVPPRPRPGTKILGTFTPETALA